MHEATVAGYVSPRCDAIRTHAMGRKICVLAAKRLIFGPMRGMKCLKAVLGTGSNAMHLCSSVLTLGLGLATGGVRCYGADGWGGSLALTSDYFVKGITRSNDLEALQLDLHYVDNAGLVAGAFASNTQIDPYGRRDVELNGYAGFAWAGTGDWHGRIFGSYYAYPWNAEGSRYNYEEVDLDLGYQSWLDIGLSYSPGYPRLLDRRIIHAAAESVELNLQHPLIGKLSAGGGVGYSELAGPGGTGYAYWSVEMVYDLAPVVLSVSYIDTSAGAKRLFDDDAATGRWVGTVMWRF
ncbi:MAG TPA: TorF family putative porin [Candidatus Binataceae bacterium]|nr:TorF family putative porin [Candidatus Binataceae bacterium]